MNKIYNNIGNGNFNNNSGIDFSTNKEKQINNKSIDRNKITSLYKVIDRQKFEFGSEKSIANFGKRCKTFKEVSDEIQQIDLLTNFVERLSDRTVINFIDDSNKIIKKVDC